MILYVYSVFQYTASGRVNAKKCEKNDWMLPVASPLIFTAPTPERRCRFAYCSAIICS